MKRVCAWCGKVLGYVKGGAKGDVLLTFVIHEHEALRAGWHHDLRLERNGVLKSWAVPRGVPEESRVRRIAIA